MKNDVALVFPVFNALEYTKKCLEDIYSKFDKKPNETLPLDIIITDDNSSDGSYIWIKENYPHVYLQKGDGNLWWSGGVNKGIEYAFKDLGSQYILLWNNDITPAEDYFKNLFAIINANPDLDLICSKVYQLDKEKDTVLSLGGIFDPKTGTQRLYGWKMKDNEDLMKPREADWFGGMGTLINKKVFDKIGLFDQKNFPQYHGDADFGLRATKAGFKLIARPELKIWNDRTNTGLSNDKSFKIFIRSLFTLKSNFNLYRDILFYRRHATSIKAYRHLLIKYYRHIGGFIKWKTLALFGKTRQHSN